MKITSEAMLTNNFWKFSKQQTQKYQMDGLQFSARDQIRKEVQNSAQLNVLSLAKESVLSLSLSLSLANETVPKAIQATILSPDVLTSIPLKINMDDVLVFRNKPKI